MSEAIPLPPRPHLEHYKKLARDLQHACQSGEPEAIRQWYSRWRQSAALHPPDRTSPSPAELHHEAQRAEQRWLKFRMSSKHALECALSSAQFFLAREHGFASWPKFSRHIQAVSLAHSPVSRFEAAADAIINGDLTLLKNHLSEEPDLVRARSTRAHHSTLLHYVSANGVEDFRQKTPPNILAIATLLLDQGAEVDAESHAYGGGSTALGLVATSVHPQRAGVQLELMQLLLDRGARIDKPSAAGHHQPLVRVCLANGQPRAAEFLANLGGPLDLEAAAALGHTDLLPTFFDESGALRPPATTQQMESGFLYACAYGQPEAAAFLMDKGIDINWKNSEGRTGLHAAAYGAQTAVVRLLLARGCPADIRDEAYDATPLDVALYVRDKSTDPEERERCTDIAALLAAHPTRP